MEELNGVADKVKTEEAASTQPCEGLHRSKGVTVLCGWAIHGIFCCCSGETVVTQLMPRHATVSNINVQCVLPIRTMKSDEIEQEEYDKYGKAAESTKRYVGRFFTTDDFKNTMPSNLSLVMGNVDSDDSPLSTSRELLQQHELGYPLNDTANSAQQIEAMMRQTLGVEADTMIDGEKKVPDKEPPEDNETLRLRLGMPEPRPAPCSPEALSYREPNVRKVVASCQDEIEVVTEPTSAQPKENETPGSKKIKIPLKAKAGLVDIYQDFVSLKPDGSVVEIFDNCEGTVEKVIGEHYLVINLPVPPDDGGKKIRILATSTDQD